MSDKDIEQEVLSQRYLKKQAQMRASKKMKEDMNMKTL
jgi:hypothetical protein